jgi:microcystin-dependent protein
MSDPYLGEIRMVGFNFAPVGWALCNGALVSISQNNALFALLGVTFGGNGVNTFGLPDLQGRSPVGAGSGAGLSPIVQGDKSGNESVALLINNLPSHTHTAQVTGGLSVSGTLSIPACSAPTSGTLTATPGPTTVLGPVSAAGRAGELYTTTASNTTLAPANVQLSGPSPAITIGQTGNNQPVALRNPYLGLTMIIAMQGIFPSRP